MSTSSLQTAPAASAPPAGPQGYLRDAALNDFLAAATVTFLAIPQGVAYAIIAGLPPVMGLYATAIPTIVGALARSSRHVITGPSNALSLLVGSAVAAETGLDPVATAALLALMVGIIQVAAGGLRLGALVDFISMPVVVGYIAGAGVLIAIGQLPNLTRTIGVSGNLFEKVHGWIGGVGAAHSATLVLGLGTTAGILLLRWWNRRIPGAIVLLTIATIVSIIFDFTSYGILTVGDLAPVPSGLPPFAVPAFDGWVALIPFAIATTVLSLVESSAVARALATRSGQRLNLSREFVGQGLANVSAAFFGAYPCSGSLSRSDLNLSSGARTRYAGVMSGALMLLVLLFFGPVVNYTPIAALAGLLLVISVDLVNVPRIREIVVSGYSDGAAFAATCIGTWILPLDKAIYLGAAISVGLFLRRARLLRINQIVIDDSGQLRELSRDATTHDGCPAVRILQVDGQLFFAAAGELQDALDNAIRDVTVRVLIVRMRRAQGMDVTVLGVFESTARSLADSGRQLMLVGLDEHTQQLFERTGFAERVGNDHVHSGADEWFRSLDAALVRAREIVGDHECADRCRLDVYASGTARNVHAKD